MTVSIRRATSLRHGQFKYLIRLASVTGRLPECDVMLLWLTHNTGVRLAELALVEVADVLYPSGAIRPEVYLRSEITKGCRPRSVYLTHPRCLATSGRLYHSSLAAPLGHLRHT
jgi:integrase